MPEGFLDALLTPDGAKRYFILEYSYGNLDDIKGLDYQVSEFGKHQLSIKPVDNTYAVVLATENDNIISDRPVGIAFDRDYLDFYKETIGNSTNDRVRVIDTSAAFVKKALPILYLATDYFGPVLSSLYDYEFETEGDTTTLVGYNIGVGLDLNGAYSDVNDSPYAINLYTTKCSISKSTGEFTWELGENGNKKSIIKSFPLTTEEAAALTNAMFP